MISNDDHRGGRDEGDDGAASPYQVRAEYDRLMAQVGVYIAERPTPNLQRSTARRIAHAVIQLGDSIAEETAKSWEAP